MAPSGGSGGAIARKVSLMWRRTARPILFAHLALSVILGATGRAETTFAGSGTAGPQTAGGAGLLYRISFAVEGAESSHGADPGIWGSAPYGPQGPMQVTAAAASDAGGGDRFDETQNRALGRAYLARMFRRYGSWPDAIAAYNWGPARIDRWITGGRLFDKLPPAVARYQTRVLAESGAFAGITTRLGRQRLLRLEAKRQFIERRHHGYRPDAVELLYAEIMHNSLPAGVRGFNLWPLSFLGRISPVPMR